MLKNREKPSTRSCVLKLSFIKSLVKYLCGFKSVSAGVSIKQASPLLMKYGAALSKTLQHLSEREGSAAGSLQASYILPPQLPSTNTKAALIASIYGPYFELQMNTHLCQSAWSGVAEVVFMQIKQCSVILEWHSAWTSIWPDQQITNSSTKTRIKPMFLWCRM